MTKKQKPLKVVRHGNLVSIVTDGDCTLLTINHGVFANKANGAERFAQSLVLAANHFKKTKAVCEAFIDHVDNKKNLENLDAIIVLTREVLQIIKEA